ncbi:hypothetical protein NDU88_009443 [Pleurodeles waltl]|uniref:Uncharacterized protein n=1 Tax=Pleurodeles waltl TaxID=8319 RepID=A0AAV7QUL9_PLEWA|nr:hypothetical protein NDU88_009443 [Pleurodeles waltl]
MAPPGTTSFEAIHQSIMEHREETKAESRRTQLAYHKMQGAIQRVAKAYSEFAVRMGKAETRISKLEEDDAAQRETGDLLKAQVDDTHWKLADLEDRLRRNILRGLGVPDWVESTDPCRSMINLFKDAFPHLVQ